MLCTPTSASKRSGRIHRPGHIGEQDPDVYVSPAAAEDETALSLEERGTTVAAELCAGFVGRFA
jgi:hypothetical protein